MPGLRDRQANATPLALTVAQCHQLQLVPVDLGRCKRRTQQERAKLRAEADIARPAVYRTPPAVGRLQHTLGPGTVARPVR